MAIHVHNQTERRRPRVLWCGYRPWSFRLFELVQAAGQADIVKYVADQHDFLVFMNSIPDVDIVVLAGWSWKIPDTFVNRITCIGLHPSDLPKYRGGSPLQHQIIDGLTETVCSLFLLTPEFDEGPVIAKAPMSLSGTINDVFSELVRVGAELLNQAFSDWPDWNPQPQDKASGFVCKRRKPEESRLDQLIPQVEAGTLKDLYNFIRALGDPYPNAYIEDEHGNRLLFKEVVFLPGSVPGLSETHLT